MSCPDVVRVTVPVGPSAVRVAVPAAPAVVRVATPGPPGPPGPIGASAYVHQQQSPAATWTINHNLGLKPSVELLNSGSQEIEGDVVHTSMNQTVVSFTAAVSGLARLT